MGDMVRFVSTLGATLLAGALVPGALVFAQQTPAPVTRPDPRDVTAPVKIEHVDPIYPDAVRTGGIVVVECVIPVSGVPRDCAVKESLAREFDEAALEAVRQWRYEPATLKGEPFPAVLTIKVNFETTVARGPCATLPAVPRVLGEAGISVRLPDEPELRVVELPSEYGPVRERSYALVDGGCSYRVQRTDYPEGYLGTDLAVALNHVRDSALANGRLTLQTEEAAVIDGIPARRVVGATSDGWTVYDEFFIVDQRSVYAAILAVAPGTVITTDHVEAYCGSLRRQLQTSPVRLKDVGSERPTR